MITGADWILRQVNCDFHLQLDATASFQERTRADADAIGHNRERMKLCPVSRNLPATVQKAVTLQFLG